MDDQEFSELKLRATIFPHQVGWPPAELVHWQRLHEVADEARDRTSTAYRAMDEIDRKADLSYEGKQRKRSLTAASALAEFEGSKSLARAREAVARIIEQWNEKVGLNVKPASNIAEAHVHAQIRDRIAEMQSGRMAFIEKKAIEPIVASAILTAPSFLSGLTEAEFSIVKHNIERLVAPEIAEAKATTLKALEQAEAGWKKAMNKICERAGLTRKHEGALGNPPTSEPA